MPRLGQGCGPGSIGIMGQPRKTHNLCVRIKGFGINFHYFPMNVLIGSGDNHTFLAARLALRTRMAGRFIPDPDLCEGVCSLKQLFSS